VSLVSIAVAPVVSAPVWATAMAGMGEIVQWAGDFLRAVAGLVIMLIPGIVFWLVVIGFIAIVQHWSPSRSASDRTKQHLQKHEGSHVEGGWEHNIA